ncbi:MAG: hypothetical protein ACYDHY_19890 [Acidiferrobacterales bacterium]
MEKTLDIFPFFKNCQELKTQANMTKLEAIEEVYPAKEHDQLIAEAQEYMRRKNLGFMFLETGEAIFNDDLAF